LQHCVLLARRFSERADEEGRGPLLQPAQELAVFAIERVEQHDAAQAIVGATGVEHERGRVVAAAIGRDHDRRVVERAAGAGIAVKVGQAVTGFAQELGEHTRLPEPSGAGIEGVHRELRRHEHRVEPGFGDLPRHRLAIAHVAFERRFVAVEEHDHERRAAGIKSLGDVQQDALVAVGLVLPVGPAAHRGVTVPLTVRNIEERAVLLRHLAAIGERRHVERDQRRL
jgi:selenocysteine lyase/cysteine desulfurase